jgi:hypothetical protein
MSINLSSAVVTEFDTEVKHQYQGMGKLRKAVTLRTGVIGSTYEFRRMGRGLARQTAPQADITPMDVGHAKVVATLEDWDAGEYTDIFKQAEINFDEQQELAQTIAGGLTRREDQLILDALDGVTFAATNDGNPATGLVEDISASRNFDFQVVRRVSRHFNELEVEAASRHFAVQAHVLDQLLSLNQVTSSDFATMQALMRGEIGSAAWMGFNWHIIGERDEGGLAGATTVERAYAWHKAAVGLAIGIDHQTNIDWVPQKKSHLALGLFKAGSAVREPQGVVRVIYDETA